MRHSARLSACCVAILFSVASIAAQTGVPASVQPVAPNPYVLVSPSPTLARHAMVVSIHHDASDAGVEVLKSGGNAVDAAVAVGFALAVVFPQAGNLGGGGFMLVRMKTGEAHFLDYRERAPAAASAGMYLDARGNVAAATRRYASSREKVFACGDMRRGQSLVVWAIREGRQCAAAIDAALMGATVLPR